MDVTMWSEERKIEFLQAFDAACDRFRDRWRREDDFRATLGRKNDVNTEAPQVFDELSVRTEKKVEGETLLVHSSEIRLNELDKDSFSSLDELDVINHSESMDFIETKQGPMLVDEMFNTSSDETEMINVCDEMELANIVYKAIDDSKSEKMDLCAKRFLEGYIGNQIGAKWCVDLRGSNDPSSFANQLVQFKVPYKDFDELSLIGMKKKTLSTVLEEDKAAMSELKQAETMGQHFEGLIGIQETLESHSVIFICLPVSSTLDDISQCLQPFPLSCFIQPMRFIKRMECTLHTHINRPFQTTKTIPNLSLTDMLHQFQLLPFLLPIPKAPPDPIFKIIQGQNSMFYEVKNMFKLILQWGLEIDDIVKGHHVMISWLVNASFIDNGCMHFYGIDCDVFLLNTIVYNPLKSREFVLLVELKDSARELMVCFALKFIHKLWVETLSSVPRVGKVEHAWFNAVSRLFVFHIVPFKPLVVDSLKLYHCRIFALAWFYVFGGDWHVFLFILEDKDDLEEKAILVGIGQVVKRLEGKNVSSSSCNIDLLTILWKLQSHTYGVFDLFNATTSLVKADEAIEVVNIAKALHVLDIILIWHIPWVENFEAPADYLLYGSYMSSGGSLTFQVKEAYVKDDFQYAEEIILFFMLSLSEKSIGARERSSVEDNFSYNKFEIVAMFELCCEQFYSGILMIILEDKDALKGGVLLRVKCGEIDFSQNKGYNCQHLVKPIC